MRPSGSSNADLVDEGFLTPAKTGAQSLAVILASGRPHASEGINEPVRRNLLPGLRRRETLYPWACPFDGAFRLFLRVRASQRRRRDCRGARTLRKVNIRVGIFPQWFS